MIAPPSSCVTRNPRVFSRSCHLSLKMYFVVAKRIKYRFMWICVCVLECFSIINVSVKCVTLLIWILIVSRSKFYLRLKKSSHIQNSRGSVVGVAAPDDNRWRLDPKINEIWFHSAVLKFLAPSSLSVLRRGSLRSRRPWMPKEYSSWQADTSLPMGSRLQHQIPKIWIILL